MKDFKIINLLVVLLIVLSITTSCQPQEQYKGEVKNAESTKIQKVEVVRPSQRSFVGEVLMTGTAQPDQIVTLYAMENGMLQHIRKDIGDKVFRGEAIAQLQNPMIDNLVNEAQAEIATKTAQLTAAKARHSANKSLYDRLKSIHTKTPALTTIAELEQAQGASMASEADIETANAMLNTAEVQKAIAQKRKNLLTVTAPFSGFVTNRFVDRGAMIQSGLNQSNPQALLEIQKTNPIRVAIPVPGSDATGIAKGMKVQVTIPELSGTATEAEISRISNALDPMAKTMQVEIDLPNPEGNILAGMYVKALLQVESKDKILSLPIDTRISYKNEEYVFAVQDGKVTRIPVKSGLTNQNYFEIIDDNITADMLIISKGKGLVKSGQIVDPIIKEQQ